MPGQPLPADGLVGGSVIAAHLMGMSAPTTHTVDRARRPAGSPAGGQFAATARAESDLDLPAPDPQVAGIPHPVAWMRAGEARPADLMSVVRAGLPDHEDGTPASLTADQVRVVLTRHLPGLGPAELEAHVAEIEQGASRLDEVEVTDPDDLDPGSLSLDTSFPVSLDEVRADYGSDADAVSAWRDQLRDWWAAHTQGAIHTAWSLSLQRRDPAVQAVAR